MATRNKRKLAALKKENCEEHPRSNLTQNSAAPRSQEDYITQVYQEIEGRVTKKLSQEFSRTENRILGALARLDGFLMNPLLQGQSGSTPETSGNTFNTNQGTNEDDPQSDPHPEAGSFGSQMIRNSGQETCCDMMTGVQRESLCCCDNMEHIVGDVEDQRLREELRSCQSFLVDSNLEWARHKVFNYTVETRIETIVNDKLDHFFNYLKCAEKLSLPFGFNKNYRRWRVQVILRKRKQYSAGSIQTCVNP